MALDRIRPLKIESPASGGTQEDAFPTDADHNEDFADLRGIVFQDDTSDDELVYASRDASGNMIFTDIVTGTVYTLSQLASGGTDMNDLIISRNNGQVMVSRNTGNVLVHR